MAQSVIDKAVAEYRAGRPEEAKRVLMQAASKFPDQLQVVAVLVEVLLAVGEFEAASYWVGRWVKAAPTDGGALLAQVKVASGRGRGDEAIVAARRFADALPGHHEPLRTLAWVLHKTKKFREAAEVAARALELSPRDADLWQKRAVALQSLGRVEEAGEAFMRGAMACPDSVALAEGAAMCTNYQWDCARLAPGSDEKTSMVRGAHERFAQLLKQRQPTRSAPTWRSIAAGERLRVGIISPDLRRHSVGAYAEAIFRHIDRTKIEFFAYSTNPNEDAVTLRLKELNGADHWRAVGGQTPENVEHAIRADRLDVLLELSGLTIDHSLAVIARKPAPIIASYIGYPSTTGLDAVDFRIVDSLTDPAAATSDSRDVSAADRQCTEQLVRLDPCFLCYTPPQGGEGGDLPDVSWTTPEARRGSLVFGSFNNLVKTNDRLMALWARLLRAVPDSRLALKAFGLGDDEVREDVRSRCLAAGIPLDRLDLLAPPRGIREHLASYNTIDIGLDAFPYHGTTTTCEAMLMGVPVVSLAGGTHVSRVGVSLLTAVGLQDLVAHSEDEYIEIASRLAGDRTRLHALRTGLRARFLNSEICNGPAYGQRLTRALIQMAGMKTG